MSVEVKGETKQENRVRVEKLSCVGPTLLSMCSKHPYRRTFGDGVNGI
jgi:hypothetical protein